MDAAQLRSGSPDRAPSTSASGNATSYPGADDGNAGGAKVWVLVLLFALLLLPFLPSAVRRGGTPWGGGGGGISLKSGWDVVNLCLVLFAILCGLLGRGGEGESAPAPGKKEPAPGMDAVWESYSSGTQQQQERHAGTGGIRRMKSTSSYPELRLGSDGVWALASPDAAWRFRDDAELEYRPRRPERTWDVHPRAPEVKTIPVDTFVERRRGEPRRRRRNVERLPNMAEVEEERPQAPPRSSNAEAVGTIPEQETAPVEVGEELGVEEVRNPSRAPRPRRRSRSVEYLPRPEELETEIVVEEVRIPPPAMFPPGTPPPPPPPPPSTASRSKKNKRNGSVGGAKELASAIALFYQKKRKSITMKAKRRPHHHHHHHCDDHSSPPSSDASASPDAAARSTNAAPPPPPPPPPSSIFSNLFKKGSKSRRIHSVAPPPPPPPPTRRPKKPPTPPSRPAPAAPPPPPVRPRAPRAHAHTHGHSSQPPMYPRRVYYTYYPPSPPTPPPPPPPPVSEGEEDAPSVTASPAPAYCESPDVNAKADRFIESFREGLKLEKLNSYREKWQRQIREEAAVAVGEDEDGEFMVIGSLFGDDDISLPETPATAAVAVGF